MASRAEYGGSRRRSAREWAHLIRAWKRSGRTAKDFAASEGVSAHSLSWWRWRLRSARIVSGVRLARVDVEPEAVVTSDSAGTSSWELVTRRGTLRVYRGIDEERLRAVLRALVRNGE